MAGTDSAKVCLLQLFHRIKVNFQNGPRYPELVSNERLKYL